MKILYICNRFFPAIGGVETHILNIAKRFISDGHDVQVVCSDMVAINTSERFKNKNSTKEGINIKRFYSFKLFGLDPATIIPYLPIYLLLNIRKYDVVHAHSYGYFSSWIPILVCRLLNKRVIYTPHYADETVLPIIIKRLYDKFFAGWSFRMATLVVALTGTERAILISKFGIKSENILVIPNGIDLSEYSDAELTIEQRNKVLSKYGINTSNKNIIIVSRIAKNKGHIFLLKAFKNFSNNCNLIIVGKDWGEKEILTSYIKSNSIHNVFFLDNIDDKEKNKLLKSSEVFVLPSIGGESFGIVLLEAMANGVPVVASDVGGVRDLIIGGKNGYLVKPRDVKILQENIEKMLYGEKRKIKKYCRSYATNYDWGVIYRKLNSLYESIVYLGK